MKKNHAIRIIPAIIIVILVITVFIQDRKIHELEKINSNSNKEEQELAALNTVVSYSEADSYNNPAQSNDECKGRIKELEAQIADMQSWQDYLEETMAQENPEINTGNERIIKNLKTSLSGRFESFIEENSLSEAIKTKFIELLAEREQARMDTYRNSRDRQNIQKEIENIQSKYDELIADLLTGDEYYAYKEYVDSEQDRNIVRSFQVSALTNDNKLDRQQEKDLAAAIYRKRLSVEDTEGEDALRNTSMQYTPEDRMKRLKAQKEIFNDSLDAARGILTDSQMKKYEKYIDLQVSSIEMSEKRMSLLDNSDSDTE